MPQDPEQKLSGTLSLLLVSEETPQGEGQKEGLRGVPPGRGGPEEADHKRAVAVCWALGTCSPDGAWRKVMSVSDIHSQELLGLPVSLPTFQFSQGSGHSQGIKGWCPPPCWRGELRRGHCAPCCAAGARPMCILQRAESVRREDTVRTVRWQETSKPAGSGGSMVSGHGACGGSAGEDHSGACKGESAVPWDTGQG